MHVPMTYEKNRKRGEDTYNYKAIRGLFNGVGSIISVFQP